MKILLTGARGMVGRNIQEHPAASQHSILTPSSQELNLLSFSCVENFLNQHRPDIVIHCAGKVGGIQANIKRPVDYLVENLDMGRNILLAARNANIPRVINMASSCMYPKDCEGSLSEAQILAGPLEPTNEGYALAKITTMKLGQYINRENKQIEIKTLIPCNLYGRWDKFSEENSHMIPAVIKKIHLALENHEESVEIWGTGNARREFMDAQDLADFVFFSLAHWEKIPDVINVGIGADHSINDYYQTIAKVLGYRGKFHHDLKRPEGMKRKLVSTQIADQLGWKAKIDLENGIKRAYEFYLEQNRR